MHRLRVNGKPQQIVEHWGEFKLKDAVRLNRAIDKMPEKLKLFYAALVKKESKERETELSDIEETFTHTDRVKHFPKYYAEALTCVSDIPKKVMRYAPPSMRTTLYNKYASSFVLGLMYLPADYVTTSIESFKFEGKIYLLPATKEKLGSKIPFADVTAIEFCEVADLEIEGKKVAGGKYEYAANIISILCRPKGEEYDEDTSLKQAEKFQELTMDIVFEVFFCIIKRSITLQKDTETFLRARGAQSSSKQRKHRASKTSDGTQA